MGYELRRLRRGVRLTQTTLAELLGVTLSSVTRWERGHAMIDRRTELAIEYLLLRMEVGEFASLQWVPRKRRARDPVHVKLRKWLLKRV
jgi:transcriptional regulator with XRE-family HTH domain